MIGCLKPPLARPSAVGQPALTDRISPFTDKCAKVHRRTDWNTAMAILLGSLVGLILGLTGAGGGVLAVPALTMGLGLSLTDAAPVSLIAIAVAALLGAVSGLRHGQVRYRAALLMAAMGMVCAPLGVWVARQLPQLALVVVFCMVMLIIATRLLLQARATAAARQAGDGAAPSRNCILDPDTGRFRWNSRCSATLACIGAIAGVFTGMLGVGGGFLIVPAFRQFSELSLQAAAATSLAVIALVSSFTVAGTLLHGARIPAVGWIFIGSTGLGMLAGRRVAHRLPAHWLQIAFALLILAVASYWLGHQLL